jgi:hypothetical protein
MKRILFLALGATLLASSCQKTEVLNPVGNVMTFSTEIGKLTKASGEKPNAAATGKTDNLMAQDFRVWAYCAFDNENTTTEDETNTVYDGMSNLWISYSSTTEKWAPEGGKEYYWPGVNKDLFFFAVSGADQEDASATVTFPITTGSKPTPVNDKIMLIEGFNVLPSNPNIDLMVADYVKQQQKDKSVNLMFHHALSKVEFLFKTKATSNMRVLLQSIEVDGLDDQGTLTVTTDEDKKVETKDTENTNLVVSTTYPVVLTWETSSTATADNPIVFTDNYEEKYTAWPWPNTEGVTDSKIELADGTIVDLATTIQNGFDDEAKLLTSSAEPFATWLVLPQSVAGKKVTVTYIVNKRQFKTIFSLDQTINSWDKNQYIKYIVDLTPNQISFKSEVTPWEQYDANPDNKDDNDKDIMDDIEMQN